MRAHPRNFNFYLVLIGDMVLFALAHGVAYFIRFEFSLSDIEIGRMMMILPVTRNSRSAL